MNLPFSFIFPAVAFILTAPLWAVDVQWNAAGDIPITSSSFDPGGQAVQFLLNFAPPTGTELMVVDQTDRAFMGARFSNLKHGQKVNLGHAGITYPFVANYFGGSGNDLVLVWAKTRIFVWGESDGLGQYEGMAANIPSPRLIDAATDGKTVLSLAAGRRSSFAILSDGSISAWGYPSTPSVQLAPFQVGRPVTFPGKIPVALATGLDHGLALCSDGTVVAWGGNATGALGNGTLVTPSGPVAVSTDAAKSGLAGKQVVAVCAGQGFSLALCPDGTLCSWGSRALGHPTIFASSYPIVIDTTSPGSPFFQKTIVSLSAGYLFAQVLCSDGTIIGWGQNDAGQIGIPATSVSTVPKIINRLEGVSALHGRIPLEIASGGDHGLARCADGVLVSWGYNANGQRGTNNTGTGAIPGLVLMDSIDPPSALRGKTISRIAGGINHSLALCTDGTIAAWGRNPTGTLPYDSPYPVKVDDQILKLSPGARAINIQRSALSAHNLLLVAYPNDLTAPEGGDFALRSRTSFSLAENNTGGFGWQDATPPFRYSITIDGTKVIDQRCMLGRTLSFQPPLTNGRYTVIMEVMDMCNNVTSVSQTINVSSIPVGTWKLAKFGIDSNEGPTADDFDFDGDGVPNLAEYAFQTDPKTADSHLIPQWTMTSDTISVDFEMPIAVEGISYSAEINELLASYPPFFDWRDLGDFGKDGHHSFTTNVQFDKRMFFRFRIRRL